ncbi:hypothetical protein NDI76_06855 [Halogeometricum sp. S1BR25-6]|uniref:DUF7527 domain-containing protein n=1 Tax=Halogeometricum salsisoli TaxID=2950536 RepID=A0ABU2GCB9_9EURY|nr:hypothetical protein [Halogeometricum sp. S1BR25-6]MDS0298456.1 hypothetical protein [Halogeometricum sp. S1BR25-6]
MDGQTIDTVREWETVPVETGYEGLHRLADEGFSGAVSSGTTWAFALNGRFIGVFEGSLESFEGAELTAHRAPDPALSLLFAMRETGGETRASYYTNDTPLSEADETLSSGGFTGYVELSDNVLSGDYYVAYYGGKSMSVAFVGANDRLVTGDEAFEQADDEVGIYEVKEVDLRILDLPERPDDGADGERVADESPAAPPDDPRPDAQAPAAAAADEPEEPEVVEPEAEERATAPGDDLDSPADGDDPATADAAPTKDEVSRDDADPAPTAGPSESEARHPTEPRASAPTTDEADEEARETDDDDGIGDSGEQSGDEDPAAPPDDPRPDAQAPEVAAADEPEEPETVDPEAEERATAPPEDESEPPVGGDSRASADTGDSVERTADVADADAAGEARSGDDPFSAEEKWREARSIPSLDPSESSTQNGEGGADATAAQRRRQQSAPSDRHRQQREQRQQAQKRRHREEQEAKRRREEAAAAAAESAKAEASESAEAVTELRGQLEAAETRRDELAAERDELEAERDELEAERDEHRDRAEELEARVESLEAEVERLEAQLASPDGEFVAEESMSPEAALSGTNLFVRYRRKGRATLEDAHDGRASREEVVENLRLEHHTTFDTAGLAVNGVPYEEFLRESTEYAFAEWVVTDLLYEIGETGNRTTLADLFDSLPRIDRIELRGVVDFETEEGTESREFDVIFRDQMGDALFVADMNTARTAATEATVASLVENARAVAESSDAMATAFYVTESFFEPEALEAVAEETGGGFLSRSKRLSFVKLSRKQGYHVCLVEARNNEFHVNVPDL